MSALQTFHDNPQVKDQWYSFGFDPKSGQVVLESALPMVAFADVTEPFQGLIAYRQEPASNVVNLSRTNDFPPYWGGVNVSSQYHSCTAGFTVHKTSTGLNYMVTAAHCNAGYDLVPFYQPSGNYEGQTRFTTSPGLDSHDMSLIGDQTYGGYIYTGNATGVGNAVKGAGDPAVSAYYCFDGATTFETCSHLVSATNQTICGWPEGWGCKTNMVVLSGGTPPAEGDSGGAMFIWSGGSPYIRGIIIGKKNDNTQFYIHKWSTISTIFGVTIVTS